MSFVLSHSSQETPPTNIEKTELRSAGLGEQIVSLDDSADMEEIRTALYESCPKLSDAGGFEIMRHERGVKNLTVIRPPKEGISIGYLKKISRSAIFYVRPIQSELSLTKSEVYTCSTLFGVLIM